MPDNVAHRAAMRVAGHSIRCYASFIAPSPIATGTLSSTPPYPMGGVSPFVNVSYVTGSHLLVKSGMEIAFFDPVSGLSKGRSHIRYTTAASITALSLPIREYTQAMLNLASGDVFRVYAEWRMHDKLVAALADFPPDMRFYADADAGDEPEPVVNSGGDWAGFVDGYGTASELPYATVPMKGSTSFTVYPPGGTVLHLWTLPSGVTFAPGSAATDANPVLRVPVGTYVITHEGTDPISGRVRESHPSIRVHNAADPPHRVLATAYEGTADDGWNWEIEVVAGAVDFTTIPDGCKDILWGRERINGAWQSFRNASPGRAHILGVGYVARDTSSGSGVDGVHRLTFEVISPLMRMKQIKSYSKVMLEDANPDSWSEITELGVLRGVYQIIQYYLMLVEAGFDLIPDNDLFDERYPAHFLDSASFYDQTMELVRAIDARMTCDRTGRFDLHTHPANIPLADRASVTLALELADADILDYEWTREHFAKVAQYKVSGVSGGATDNKPVFSLYPGAAPGEAMDAPEIARLVLDATDPQGDINARAGRYGALADMLFYDADGVRHNAFDLRLKLRGAYDCFDFYKEYIEVTIADNKRGLDFSGRRFYLLSSTTTFDGGTSITDLVLRMETNAATGETYVPPGGEGGGETPPPPPLPPTPPVDIVRGTGRIVILTEDDHLRRTTTFNRSGAQTGPAWDSTDLTALTGWGGGDHAKSGVQRAFFTDTLRLAGEDNIYLLNSIINPTTTTQNYTFPYAWHANSDRFIQTERCAPLWEMVLTWDYPNAVMKVTRTTDGGTTWATVSAGSTGGAFERACLWMSGHTPGLARIATFSAPAGGHGNVSLFQTTDFGASWSAVALISSIGRPAIRIDCPYADENITRVCIPEYSGVGIIDLLKTYEIVGSTVTDVSAEISYGGDTYGAQDNLAMRTWDADARRILVVGSRDNQGGSTVAGIFTSTSGIADMVNVIPPAMINALNYNNAWIGGDGLAVYIAGYGNIFYSGDFLTSEPDERTGSGIGTARVLNLWGW